MFGSQFYAADRFIPIEEGLGVHGIAAGASRSGRVLWRGGKHLVLPDIEPQFLGLRACSQVIIPTALLLCA